MPSPPTSDLQSATGALRVACRPIRWTRSGKADISNASRATVRRAMPRRTRRTRDQTRGPDVRRLHAILGAALVLGGVVIGARSAGQTTPYAPKQSDRPAPMRGDEPGFDSIFDGKT